MRKFFAAGVIPLTLCVALSAFIVVFYYVYEHRLKLNNADGVYYNKCCGFVYVSGDELTTDRARVKIDQRLMKFGLTVFFRQDPRIFPTEKEPRTPDKFESLIFDRTEYPSYFETADLHANVFRFYRSR
jgi:hypothetical protein